MKKNLLSLAVASLILGGCTATHNNTTPNGHTTTNSKLIASDFFSELALHDAVRARDIKMVQYLLEQKSAVDTKDIYGYTPLHIAVRLNEYEITKLLIENGASVNNFDNYQDTPLLDATRDNYSEVSKLLICNGAAKDVADKHQMTPLHNSSKNNNLEISEMLTVKDITPYCQPKEEEITESIAEEEAIINEPITLEEVVQSEPQQSFVGLYDALIEEFKDDFEPWNAELSEGDMLFRFNNPIALFETGKSDLKEGFTDILSDFFPRYLKVIEGYKDEIQEIRIEGHTSSEYSKAQTDAQRYTLNKILSQERADEVRNYAINKASQNTQIDKEWISNTFKPYGMSYDNLIMNPDGTENLDASRRVDFKIEKITQ